MLNCIVIEDQFPAQQILKKYIGDHESLHLVKGFNAAIEASTFLKEHAIDLIFLDINLPQVSGMEFLRRNSNLPPVILTTAYSEYALESYEYNTVDYLLKPFSFARFNQAITKVLSITHPLKKNEAVLNTTSSEEIFIKSGHEILKLKYSEILYIKSDGDYTEAVTATKKYLTYLSLKDWLNNLQYHFCQVHKSYLINMNHLSKISSNKIHLTGKHLVPIGRAYKKGFIERNANPTMHHK
ncbi:MAG: DNA-binding response regulator [Cytophagaceae bacterium]|jgi:DNA-binding LytR/AlgR family response regulator|nr:DNA-binding response regulator [Cytophagaceae bacterium]